MKSRVYHLIVIVAVAQSCSDAEFAGNGANGIVRKNPTPVVTPSDDITTPTDQTGITTDSGNIPACVRGTTAKTFSFSISNHSDSHRSVSGMPQSDVAQSPVQTFNVSEIAGDILPVSRFGLDDVAFIVKETDQFSPRGRDITIPDHALIIKDGNNINGASGRIDSTVATTYRYKGQQVTISTVKQNLATALNNIASMGITPINHNQIKISDMRAKGFVDASGNVAFKVVHVAHGYGYITMEYGLLPCK